MERSNFNERSVYMGRNSPCEFFRVKWERLNNSHVLEKRVEQPISNCPFSHRNMIPDKVTANIISVISLRTEFSIRS